MKKVFFLLLSVTVIIISCKKALNQESTQNNIAYFPNTIGNNWRYKIFILVDSLPFGTMDVNIIKDTILQNNEMAKVWAFDFVSIATNRHSFDTNYVVSTEQLVKIYAKTCPGSSCGISVKQSYVLPLVVGNSWLWPFAPGWMDTTRILSQGSLTVPAGTFENTFNLFKIRPHAPNSDARNSIWLTPYVGMIQLNQFELNLGPVFGTGIWVLESYSLH